jgi:hypothetical protein
MLDNDYVKGQHFGNAYSNLENGRKLFRTHRGYLGLTSSGTREGDIVCLFLGTDIPFILRKDALTEAGAHTYALVSECYIHGLMAGEGMAMGNVQEIILR